MLGDAVDVIIQKVDVLRHQIDLEVVLPEGCEAMADDAETEADYDTSDED